VPNSALDDLRSPAGAGSRRNWPDAGLAAQTNPTKLVRTEQIWTEQGCLSHSKTSRYNTNPAQKNREIRVAFPIPLVDNPSLPHRPLPAILHGPWQEVESETGERVQETNRAPWLAMKRIPATWIHVNWTPAYRIHTHCIPGCIAVTVALPTRLHLHESIYTGSC